MNELTHLDLFSGIGGFALAARWAGFRTVGFCEIEPYAQLVLAKNFLADANRAGVSDNGREDVIGTTGALQADGEERERIRANTRQRDHAGAARIVSDIRTLDGSEFAGVTLITGGFPCQPFSCAGKRRGKEDDRHLWPEMLRVISQARPAWVLGENVAGIINMELDTVLSDLEELGYACRAFVIPACGVDARHRRNRVWIVANRDESGLQGRNGAELRECAEQRAAGTGDSSLADASGRTRQRQTPGPTRHVTLSSQDLANGGNGQRTRRVCHWLTEPDVGRVAHGIPARVDRLRGLGNAIVPQVAFEILKGIAEIERGNPVG